MSNLSQFISANLLLCTVFVLAVLVYLIFEIRQARSGRFQLSTQAAISLTNREKGIFLDIRDGKQYNESHIVGAINSPFANLKSSTKFLNKYKNAPIVVYCITGSQSANACDLLKKDGYDKAYTLKGGFKQWLNDKLPIDSKVDTHQPQVANYRKEKNTTK